MFFHTRYPNLQPSCTNITRSFPLIDSHTSPITGSKLEGRDTLGINMAADILLRFIYPPPPSLFISTMSAISFVSLANGGFRESKGKHMQYSKFWNVGTLQKSSSDHNNTKAKVSTGTGMIFCYAPAFLAALASFFLLPGEGFRFALLRSALTIHFFKRIVEVLFVHKFSSYMDIEAAITISTSYFFSTVTTIYAQHLSRGLQEPPIDLKYAGIALFLLGIGGNFYHHVLLSKLRSQGEKQYRIPKGGLFGWVICPHYLFEILGFFGISCISQTLYSFSFAFGTTFYLVGKSYATWKWYQSKFDDFPENIKALVPYIF